MSKAKTLDSTKVEKAAVQAVRNLIQPCERVNHKIDEDDKNKLVDGSLELYSCSELSNANLIGVIDIQVKGTTSKLRVNKRGFAKYSVETECLRRYLDVYHGILFFCATVDRNTLTAKDVYYAQLLPYDISKILSGTTHNQKTVSVRFKPFPKDPQEITRFLLAFNSDREKQLKADVAGYGFLDGEHKIPAGISSMSFSVQLFPGEDVTSLASWREGTYIYGQDESGHTLVFDKMEDVVMFARGIEAKVSSGDFELTAMVMSGEHEDGQYLEIEGVSLILSNDTAKLNYTVTGGFHRRYNTVRLAHELISTGLLSINDQVVLHLGESEESSEHLSRLATSVATYNRIVSTLDQLGIATEWDPANMSAKELNDIGFMRSLLIEGEHLTEKSINSPIVHFDVQGTRVYALSCEIEDGVYEFVDIFDEELFFVFGWPDNRAADQHLGFDPVPPVVAIGKDGFKTIANIDPEKLEQAFTRLPITEGNQWPLNQKLLEMLEAYDEGCALPNQILACAALLARKLYEFDVTSETYLLNLMQTIKRKRDFTHEEIQNLQDVAIASDRMSIRAAAYLLLGENAMALNCLNRCSEEERSQIERYPISHFLKEIS